MCLSLSMNAVPRDEDPADYPRLIFYAHHTV